jgi:hypothetical protein
VPFCFIAQISKAPLRPLQNAICLPSGEKAAQALKPAPVGA